jgi:hypothetical protein
MRNLRKILYFSLRKVKEQVVSDKRITFTPVLIALKPAFHPVNNRLACLTAASVLLQSAVSQRLRLRLLSSWILMQSVSFQCYVLGID